MVARCDLCDLCYNGDARDVNRVVLAVYSGAMNGHRQTTNAKARAAKYRHSAEGRMARKFYNMQPEVRLRKSIKRAMKTGKAPHAIYLGAQPFKM